MYFLIRLAVGLLCFINGILWLGVDYDSVKGLFFGLRSLIVEKHNSAPAALGLSDNIKSKLRSDPIMTDELKKSEELDQALARTVEDVIDYRRCSPLQPLTIYVHDYDHPLAKALAAHPSAITDEQQACLIIGFVNADLGDNLALYPPSWNATERFGRNHVIINLNYDIPIVPHGWEMIVQAAFLKNMFRPLLDFVVFPGVKDFDDNTWKARPLLMSHRERQFAVVVDEYYDVYVGSLDRIQCEGDCSLDLHSTSFCIIPYSFTLRSRLISSLRAGCIPVILSMDQPLPFQDQLDWRLASFRFPTSMTDVIPEKLSGLPEGEVFEMRRRGRIFLERLDDARALSKSLVAALSERIQVCLQQYPEIRSGVITPNPHFKSELQFASGLYSGARWNSGRDLTFTPRTLHDGAHFHGMDSRNKVTIGMAGEIKHVQMEEEYFTALIIANQSTVNVVERLIGCPYLRKVVLVWNNIEQIRHNIAWPKIHVPIEIILVRSMNQSSRYMLDERLGTEAVAIIDNQMDLDVDEITPAFELWKENRDRVVGYSKRNGNMGTESECGDTITPNQMAFIHKEFLYEYTFNLHPAIHSYIDEHHDCEDLAMAYLVSHITRNSPVVIERVYDMRSSDSSHSNDCAEREESAVLFNSVYGYNPLA